MNAKSTYPCKTEIDNDSFSIFMVAMQHHVNPAKITSKKFSEWYACIKNIGWRIHHYHSFLENERLFDPDGIFTPATRDSLLGESEKIIQGENEISWLKNRLYPKKNRSHNIETILLSLESNQQYINQELQLFNDNDPNELSFTFVIEWADIWLFNDQTGILAFKTKLLKVSNERDEKSPRISDLNAFNRILRSPSNGDYDWNVRTIEAKEFLFWPDLIFDRWLGGLSENSLNVLAKTKKPSSGWYRKRTPENSKKTKVASSQYWIENKPPAEIWDLNSRYCKILTAVQIPNIASNKDEFLWNAPITDPPINFEQHYDRYESGQWNDALTAYQRASLKGSPTVSELLLYELASTGDEGSSGGLNGKRGWQMSPTYLAKLLDEQGIEIWEYSRGLALHDSCAFLAYDSSMPTIKNTERWYYPLYVHSYHLQFRMNCFAKDIVDPELTGLIESRRIKDEFMAFRNQFWFCSITVDFQGEVIADRFKKAMRLDELYETVQSEINEISEFIDEKIERGKNAFLAALVVAFYPILYLWELSGFPEALKTYAEKNYLLTLTSTVGFVVILIIVTILFLPKIANLGQRFLSRINKLLS